MLTDTQGVDFNLYIRNVYLSIRKSWYAGMPSSAVKGQQGVIAVEFRILQDGNIPKDFPKITSGSGKNDLDAASIQAIREAAPFAPLPDKFSQPFVTLRFTFYYNVPIPPRTVTVDFRTGHAREYWQGATLAQTGEVPACTRNVQFAELRGVVEVFAGPSDQTRFW